MRFSHIVAAIIYERIFDLHLYKAMRALRRLEKHAVKLGVHEVGELPQAIKAARHHLKRGYALVHISGHPLRYLPAAAELMEEIKKQPMD